MPKGNDALEQLFLRYERICEILRSSEDDQAVSMGTEIARSVSDLKQKIADRPDRQLKRKALAGMRQGIRDIGTIARLMQEPVRAKLLAVSEGQDSTESLLPGILSRGKIATHDEWGVVRAELDRIEGRPEFASETQRLRQLIDSYEEI